MQPSIDTPTGRSTNRMRRYGPVAAIAVVAAIVAGVIVASGSAKKSSPSTVGTGGGATGALSFSAAKRAGKKIDFGPTCDPSTGRLAIPDYFAPECFAPVADNGGSTSPGVSATSIKVVLYLAQPHDPVLSFVLGAIADADSNASVEATYRGYVKFFEAFYQTYHRKVELEVLHASGTALDEVAARADAVKAATTMGAFAVWGGPVLTRAWADELAARHVLCLGCLGGDTADWYAQRAPYVWPIIASTQQVASHLVEYISKKVAGRPASHAGDPAIATKTRKLGLLYINVDANSAKQADDVERQLAARGVPLAIKVPYTLDPARLQEQAALSIAKLKANGVTSVMLSGDPVAPANFTREATAQSYFPEWIMTGAPLTDTAVFARTFDQRQWSHAFGISTLPARTKPEIGGGWHLYEWYFHTPPPAPDTYAVLYPQPGLFYAGLQAAGPKLTPATFGEGLFSLTPRSAMTEPEISYGHHGIWPYTDYNGIDDATELWWDPVATGPDEIRRQGRGLYRYVDGGRRYLPGHWPEGTTKAFDPAGTITIYDTPPPSEAPKEYPSPTPG